MLIMAHLLQAVPSGQMRRAGRESAVVAGKACEWDRMLRIFSNMNTVRVKPDVYTFTSLIRACQSCGNRWRKAVGFFEQMQRSGGTCNLP